MSTQTLAETQAANGRSERPALVGWFGSFILMVEDDAKSTDVIPALTKALENDVRVLPFEPPEPNEHWDSLLTFYPARPRPSREDLLSAADRRTGLRFLDWLGFTISAQKKNQPIFRDYDEIPAEKYWVRWDGLAFMVFWEQDGDEPVSRAGGHVAKEVIGEAAKDSGADVYFQGCRPECEFEFAHSGMKVLADEEASGIGFERDPDDRGSVLVTAPERYDPARLADGVFAFCRGAIHDFAAMKNRAQRLRNLEMIAEADLPQVLATAYHIHGEVRELSLVKRLAERWQHRGWRRDVSALTDRLWLTMAHIEAVRRAWDQERFDFQRETEDRGNGLLFEGDHVDDAAAIRSLDLTTMQMAVEQVGGRLSSRQLVVATLLGSGATLIATVVGFLLASA